jgi:hypothetical protein
MNAERSGALSAIPGDVAVVFTPDAQAAVRATVCSSPRELGGSVLRAVEDTVADYGVVEPSRLVDKWYRTAAVADYESAEAAATYLGGYGPRSILKYQESVLGLFCLKGSIPRALSVVDFGAGPSVGFAALVDLLTLLGRILGEEFSLSYRAVDRSRAMLTVGRSLCARIMQRLAMPATYEASERVDLHLSPETLLVLANVMNESEGNLECGTFLHTLLQQLPRVQDVVVIEPATEQPSRQLCGLGARLEHFSHIGPCPSAGAACTEWSFREFAKRVYSCERYCLGKWAPAAARCKFSMALFSKVQTERRLAVDHYVVVGQRLGTGQAVTCRRGEKRVIRVAPEAQPWDLVTAAGRIEEWWP